MSDTNSNWFNAAQTSCLTTSWLSLRYSGFDVSTMSAQNCCDYYKNNSKLLLSDISPVYQSKKSGKKIKLNFTI